MEFGIIMNWKATLDTALFYINICDQFFFVIRDRITEVHIFAEKKRIYVEKRNCYNRSQLIKI